ncbi:MAG: 1-deoxy-D-xylulose-5-phosphate reductoisomerase [Pseudomonadota bacterium]
MSRKSLTILGSTSTIGVNTLDVVQQHHERFNLVALTAHQSTDKLLEQCMQFKPKYAAMSDANAANKLQKAIKEQNLNIKVLSGEDAICSLVQSSETDYVMAAIGGSAGLAPTLAAATAGKRIMLANKESLVVAGQIFMDAVKKSNCDLIPVDSEHNAIFQCLGSPALNSIDTTHIDKVFITASGGPFLNTELTKLANITPEQACAHPNWEMGKKISVDSATMMNKGLEVIEAAWLFGFNLDLIDVVVHPQSILHAMVCYEDGSTLAHLGQTDMRVSIASALAWPARITSGVQALDLSALANLEFLEPSYERYPCLRLAMDAAKAQGTAPSVLNAANEIAVGSFLKMQIKFTDIFKVVNEVMQKIDIESDVTLDILLNADKEARAAATDLVQTI